MTQKASPARSGFRRTRATGKDDSRAAATKRDGKVLVLTAIMLVPLFGFAALAVDATFLMEVKKEAENAAESAALAGVMGLVHADRLKTPPDMTRPLAQARTNAVRYAAMHSVGEVASVVVDRNESNTFSGDVVVGRLRDWSYQNYPWNFDDPTKFNSVRVKVRRTAQRNGPVALFFANIFGVSSFPVEAVATARMEVGVVVGFNPKPGETASLLPFAISARDWDMWINGINSDPSDGSSPPGRMDEFGLQRDQQNNVVMNSDGNPQVSAGADGIPEMFMYPQRDGGGGVEPGNFGTVNIGPAGNSTTVLTRQIEQGIEQWEFDYLKQQGVDPNLTADPNDGNDDHFDLNGDTGISSGIKSALEKIVGQSRVFMLYSHCNVGDSDAGNNVYFRVVRYVPAVILEVQLTKNPKYIRIQPSTCVDNTAIIDPDASGPNLVFHPPRLVE